MKLEKKVFIYLQRPVFRSEEEIKAEVHFIITTISFDNDWEMVEINRFENNQFAIADEEQLSDYEGDESTALYENEYYESNRISLGDRFREIFCENCLCKFCKDFVNFLK